MGLVEQHRCVGERRRTLIVERNRFHDGRTAIIGFIPQAARLVFAIASRMRRGVIGISQISTPSFESASLTALATAAPGPIAPPSPTPFWPNSVYGEGVSMWKTRTSGISALPGRR